MIEFFVWIVYNLGMPLLAIAVVAFWAFLIFMGSLELREAYNIYKNGKQDEDSL